MTTIQRKLGSSPVELYPVGLGCMGMSEFYGRTLEEADAIRVIHRALERGAFHLDTADMYGSGANERLVGKAIADRRSLAFVATKFAIIRGEDGSFAGLSGRPEYVKQACEASLARLGIDSIDLYYQHRVDPQVPIEDTVGAMAELVKEGKVRYLGLCEVSLATLERAATVHPITAVQSELSLWSRDYETDVIPGCARLGTTFVAYSPLGRGFLSGQIRSTEDLEANDWRRQAPRFQGEAFERNLEAVKKLETWAKNRGVSSPQLALAWVLSRGPQVMTIPGTRSVERLDENIAAAELQLDDQELAELDTLLPADSFTGTRYPSQAMSLLNY